MKEEVRFSETSVLTRATLRHIQEDGILEEIFGVKFSMTSTNIVVS
jgi:hypothetical protein